MDDATRLKVLQFILWGPWMSETDLTSNYWLVVTIFHCEPQVRNLILVLQEIRDHQYSVGFILWGTWLSSQNFMVVLQIINTVTLRAMHGWKWKMQTKEFALKCCSDPTVPQFHDGKQLLNPKWNPTNSSFSWKSLHMSRLHQICVLILVCF